MSKEQAIKAKKEKKVLMPEQIYKRIQRKSKLFSILAPVVLWTFLGLTILFFCLMIKNSVGNLTEIFDLLDKKTLTGEELSRNYQYLIEKYGEWTIVGNNGGTFSVHFVNIKNAFFSGLMITYCILTMVSFGISIIVGKVLFPKLSQYYKDNNQDMVNLATLQTNAEITKKKKNKEEEWF